MATSTVELSAEQELVFTQIEAEIHELEQRLIEGIKQPTESGIQPSPPKTSVELYDWQERGDFNPPQRQAQTRRPGKAGRMVMSALAVATLVAADNSVKAGEPSPLPTPIEEIIESPTPTIEDAAEAISPSEESQSHEVTNKDKEEAQVREPEIIVKPVFEDTGSIDPQIIVWHYTAGRYEDVNHFIRAIRSNNGASVQFFIDKQGTIYQLTTRPNQLAAHAEGVNDRAIGIEIEGWSEHEIFSNPKQYQSALWLTDHLQERYDIPTEGSVSAGTGVLGHTQIDGSHLDTDYDGKMDFGDTAMSRVKKDLHQFEKAAA